MTTTDLATPMPASLRGARLRRLIGANPPALVAGAVILVVSVLVALAPWIAPYDPLEQNLGAVLQLPSSAHWLGTDTLGRDTLSRLLYGGQPALLGMLTALVVFAVTGLVLGVLAGYLGGWVDRAVGVVVDVLMSLPGIIIVLAVLSVFSQNLFAAMVVFGLLVSGNLIRVVRGAVLGIREELYVAAATISGIGAGRIMLRHVLPGITGPVTVQLAIFAGGALGVQTGLGFLGLATLPPAPSWGGMVGEAAPVMFQAPFFLFVSGGLIAVMTLAFALVGDGIRDFDQGRTGGESSSARPLRRAAPVVAPADAGEALLTVRDYTITFGGIPDREIVHGIDFSVDRGEIVALVGESGSGKTVTGLSLLGLLPANGAVTAGGAWLDGVSLTGMTPAQLTAVRGRRIGLVSQEPMVALDPLFTIGAQLDEVLRRLTRAPRPERRRRARELLTSVGLSDPDTVLSAHPHELSGGMLQRVVIAIALAGDPDLIIADEPTTALDVSVQAGILDLLRQLRHERQLTVMLITHDLAVVADLCDRVLVMRSGEIVEAADVDTLFDSPQHEYTKMLIASTPSLVELP